MSSAVLDQVETLQATEQSRRAASWLELVRAYVDAKLPAAKEVAAILGECSKTRQDLEADAALLREYRSLEATVGTIPELQTKVDAAAREMSAALKARDAAEQALKDAVLRANNLNQQHTAASHALGVARRAEAKLHDPRFTPVTTGEAAVSPEVHRLRIQLRETEAKLTNLEARITAQRQAIATLEGELEAMDGSELPQTEKNEARTKLHTKLEGARLVLEGAGSRGGLLGEEYYVKQDLRQLRRELTDAQKGDRHG